MHNLSFPPRTGPAAPRVPEGRRVYAIGDIHGRADLLDQLLAAIAADVVRHPGPGRLTLVFLGDYVDRGPESRGVVGRLLAGPPAGHPLAGSEWVALRGNHEETVLRFLDDPGEGPGWFRNGGLETVRSYAGGIAPGDEDRPAALRALLGRTLPEDHRRFLARMPLSYTEGDYLFVHAGLRPGVAIAEQDPDDLLWIRDAFIGSDESFGKMVVHGHTIAETPEVRPNRIGIDTGAYRTGRLTALVLEGTGLRFLATGGQSPPALDGTGRAVY